MHNIRSILILFSVSFLLVGCFKSSELREAEARYKDHVKISAAKYTASCHAEANAAYPPKIIEVLVAGIPPTYQDCSGYKSGLAAAICQRGNTPGTPDRYIKQDINLSERKDYKSRCIKDALSNDTEFLEQSRSLRFKIAEIEARERY